MNNINHWHASNDQSATRLSLMDYSGLNPAQVSTGGMRQAELELENCPCLWYYLHICYSTHGRLSFLFCGRIDKRSQFDLKSIHLSATLSRQQQLKG